MNTKRMKTIIQQSWRSGLIALIFVIAVNSVVRLRLIDVPLERDEGEYAYAGQLMLEGIAPYTQAYNMKLPGIYAAYAVILAIFGQTHSGIHLGLLFVNSATIVILFLLSRKLFGSIAGLASAVAFATLSISTSVQGIFANAEHFVILPAIAGLLMLVYAKERDKLWILIIGGLLFGIGFLMKQHGAAFIIFGGLYLFFSELKSKISNKKLALKCFVYILSAAAPFIATCVVLALAGVFDKFWFWTFEYASQYVSSIPFSTGMKILGSKIGPITNSSRMIWISSLIGLLFLAFNKRNKYWRGFTLGFILFSFLAICPGFYFRPHYFVLLLPAGSLLVGIAASTLFGFLNDRHFAITARITLLLFTVIVFGGSIYKQRYYLFKLTPDQISRRVYGANPFPESLEIASYISKHSDKDTRIAVIGSEPQIYFYSNRKSATGHIYTYALMETHPYASAMQEEMISEIESVIPEFIIFVNVRTSWLYRSGSNNMIFSWFDNYIKQYECIGIADILNSDYTNYVWDEQAKNYTPASSAWLKVFRKKNI
jgi:hypothetical protein